MKASIPKLKRETLSEKVERVLRQMLSDGRWQDGERLPPEAELAESFGVSQQTVRVALQRLSVQGLVDICHGDGVFAKKFSINSYLHQMSDLYVTPEMMDAVCDFRKVIEGACLNMAIEAATEEDILEMEKCVERYLSIRDHQDLSDPKWFKQITGADYDFHRAMCKAAHNSLLLLAYDTAAEVIKRYLDEIFRRRTEANLFAAITRSDGLDAHQLILNAIKAKKAERGLGICEAVIDYRVDLQNYLDETSGSL